MFKQIQTSDLINLALPFAMMSGTIIGMIIGLIVNIEIMIYTLAVGTGVGYVIGLTAYLILHNQINKDRKSK